MNSIGTKVANFAYKTAAVVCAGFTVGGILLITTNVGGRLYARKQDKKQLTANPPLATAATRDE